jgi:hypothetical protein
MKPVGIYLPSFVKQQLASQFHMLASLKATRMPGARRAISQCCRPARVTKRYRGATG